MNEVKKISLAIALAGYGMSAAAAVEDPGHIQWGPVEVTPVAEAKLGYDDNVFRDSNKKSSSVYALAASSEFKAQKGLSTYAVTVDALNKNFTSEQDASYTDLGLAADIHQEFNSRNRLDVNLGWGIYHDESSTISDTNLNAPEHKRTQAGMTYGFGSTEAKARIDLFGNYSKSDYKAGEGLDKDNKEFGATAYYRFMPKTDVLLEVKERKLGYDNEDGYDITSYLVGLNWEATAKTTGYAKVGRRTRSSAGLSSENYTGWEVGVSYMPVDRSVFQLSTSRDYGLESENPGQESFTKGTNTRLNWMYEATSKISTNTFVSYSDEDIEEKGVVQKERKLTEFGVSADWKVRRNATISLSYTNTDRNESKRVSTASEDDYRRNVYMLTAELAI